MLLHCARTASSRRHPDHRLCRHCFTSSVAISILPRGPQCAPRRGRGKATSGTGITSCNTRTKKYLVVRNLELTLFGCSLVLFGLLMWLISGLIFGLLIRTTAQCICYLLNTDHHQPRIGILSEDSRLSQASLSTIQSIRTEPWNCRHQILEA